MDMKLGQWALSNSTPVRKQSVNKTQSRKLTPKTPWNSDEKAAIIKTLSKFLSLNGLHGKAEIEEVKRSEPALQKRPWQQIKFFIKNSKDSQKKNVKGIVNIFLKTIIVNVFFTLFEVILHLSFTWLILGKSCCEMLSCLPNIAGIATSTSIW